MSQIPGTRIYIGDVDNARDATWLKSHRITTIMDIGSRNTKKYKAFRYAYFEIFDDPDQPIERYFAPAIDFIDAALAESPEAHVLIHCYAGISRSVTIAAAWLINKLKIEPNLAIAMIQNVRPQACPNAGFVAKLKKYYMFGAESCRAERVTDMRDFEF